MFFPKFFPTGLTSSSVLHVAAMVVIWKTGSVLLSVPPPRQGQTSIELQATIASASKQSTPPVVEIETIAEENFESPAATKTEPNDSLQHEVPDSIPAKIMPVVDTPELQNRPIDQQEPTEQRAETAAEVPLDDIELKSLPRAEESLLEPEPVSSSASVPSVASKKDSGVSEAVPVQVSYSTSPIYPPTILSQGTIRSDRIELSVQINTEGHVTDVKLVKSSGVDEIDLSAETAARQWRFEAIDGHALEQPQWIKLKFRYRAER
ncbi:MAG: energy transducer TonB [Pirellulales bacterium]